MTKAKKKKRGLKNHNVSTKWLRNQKKVTESKGLKIMMESKKG